MITLLTPHKPVRTVSFVTRSWQALLGGFSVGLILVALAGCTRSGSSSVELPENNGSGSDLMRDSPCACEPVDFNSRGFEWHA